MKLPLNEELTELKITTLKLLNFIMAMVIILGGLSLLAAASWLIFG